VEFTTETSPSQHIPKIEKDLSGMRDPRHVPSSTPCVAHSLVTQNVIKNIDISSRELISHVNPVSVPSPFVTSLAPLMPIATLRVRLFPHLHDDNLWLSRSSRHGYVGFGSSLPFQTPIQYLPPFNLVCGKHIRKVKIAYPQESDHRPIGTSESTQTGDAFS
jgi:hypothetical protein